MLGGGSPQDLKNSLQLVDLVVPLKRRFFDKQLEEYAACTPQIDFWTIDGGSKQELGRAVPQCDDSVGVIQLAAFVIEAGETEISNL